jgi:hypothetical protein
LHHGGFSPPSRPQKTRLKGGFFDRFTLHCCECRYRMVAAPDGFEPPMPESESGALPLGYGAK